LTFVKQGSREVLTNVQKEHPLDPTVKAQAVALLESGEMRVAEIADLLGQSRQLVATWCPGALLARRKWCAKRWNEALKGVDKAVAARMKRQVKMSKRQAERNAALSVYASALRTASPSEASMKQLYADYDNAKTDEEVTAAIEAWEARNGKAVLEGLGEKTAALLK